MPTSATVSDPQALIEDLGSRSGRRRAEAIERIATTPRRVLRACAPLHGPEAREALAEAVDRGRRHSPREVRWALVEALRRWPVAADARTWLSVMAQQAGPVLAEAALEAHRERGDPDAQADLLDAIVAQGHAGRTAQALRVLGPACPPARLLPHLDAASRAPDAPSQLAAISALGPDLPADAREALIARALVMPLNLRRAAIERLILLPGEAAAHPDLAHPFDDRELTALLHLLARSADQPGLAAALLPRGLAHHRPGPFRAAAAVVAAHPQHRGHLDGAWCARLDAARPRVRHHVVDRLEATAFTGAPASGLALLARLAGAADPWVRRRVAWRLARAPAAQVPGARRILARLVDDPDGAVARTAGWSLHDLDQHVFHGERSAACACACGPVAPDQSTRVPSR